MSGGRYFSFLAMAGIMAGMDNPHYRGDGTQNSGGSSPAPYVPREKECPKGAKNYWFNKHGEFDNDRMLKSEVVFHCFARDDQNAIRKFNNFMKQQKNDL